MTVPVPCSMCKMRQSTVISLDLVIDPGAPVYGVPQRCEHVDLCVSCCKVAITDLVEARSGMDRQIWLDRIKAFHA